MKLSTQQKMHMQRRGEHCISRMAKLNNIYKLGGARIALPNGKSGIASPSGANVGWTDCSGGAFYVMAAIGLPVYDIFDNGPIWTGSMADQMHEGESDFFTLFIKEPHNTEGHVIMRLRERPKPWHAGKPRYRFAEVGGSDNPKPGGGMSWLPSPGKGMGLTIHQRLAEFDVHRCIRGF